MNLAELQRKLLAVARAHPPSDSVPYAFEGRLMARLQARLQEQQQEFWSRALWRAAAPCLAISLLLATWTLVAPPAETQMTDLSQDLENTVLAVVSQEPLSDLGW